MDKPSQSKDSAQPDLAQYQAQWAKIHNDTIKQIKQARGMRNLVDIDFTIH